jgi:hypothetical protein
MRTEVEIQADQRTVAVSANALAQICPESSLSGAIRRPSLLRRGSARLRRHLRLTWTRIRLRFDDFRTLRLFAATCRLRARLVWMRLRYRRLLSK